MKPTLTALSYHYRDTVLRVHPTELEEDEAKHLAKLLKGWFAGHEDGDELPRSIVLHLRGEQAP